MVDEKGERLASRPLHHVNLIAHSFDLPSGRSTKSWDATLAIEARLLAAGGHAATRSTNTTSG